MTTISHGRTFWTIREMADHFNTTTRTLRYYGQQGLLDPLRDGRNRLYSLTQRRRMEQIIIAKKLGMEQATITAWNLRKGAA